MGQFGSSTPQIQCIATCCGAILLMALSQCVVGLVDGDYFGPYRAHVCMGFTPNIVVGIASDRNNLATFVA